MHAHLHWRLQRGCVVAVVPHEPAKKLEPTVSTRQVFMHNHSSGAKAVLSTLAQLPHPPCASVLGLCTGVSILEGIGGRH